jgi:hypothetical protein
MGSSPLSIPASSISINPKSAKSDQNCLALAKAAVTHDAPLDFFSVDQARKQLQPQFHQPCRSAGHRAIYAGHRALARPGGSVRAAAGAL